jgi:hypothetical protein
MTMVELRSSDELLVWLVEVSASSYSGALTRGDHLLTLAIGKRKVARPPTPNLFADWLYELRVGGAIVFDDSDARASGPGGAVRRKDVFAIRDIAVTEAGRLGARIAPTGG